MGEYVCVIVASITPALELEASSSKEVIITETSETIKGTATPVAISRGAVSRTNVFDESMLETRLSTNGPVLVEY